MSNEAILFTDGYKLDHRRQYPKGTEYVYSNWTPRTNKFYQEATDGAVFFGLQHLIQKYFIDEFRENFFNLPKEQAVKEFENRVNTFLGPNQVGSEHIAELHDLGYLPIYQRLPEMYLVGEKVRDVSTGNIIDYNIKQFNDCEPVLPNTVKKIVIIDDLCDGGRTFITALEKLKKIAKPGVKICLDIVHAVQEQGLRNVCGAFDEVIVTNSYADWNKLNIPNLTVHDVQDIEIFD